MTRRQSDNSLARWSSHVKTLRLVAAHMTDNLRALIRGLRLATARNAGELTSDDGAVQKPGASHASAAPGLLACEDGRTRLHIRAWLASTTTATGVCEFLLRQNRSLQSSAGQLWKSPPLRVKGRSVSAACPRAILPCWTRR